MTTLYYSEEAYREAMEEQFAPRATMGMAAREYGRNAGMDRPDVEWILTPWDSWEHNPFYRGKPGPHPEYPDDEPVEYVPSVQQPVPTQAEVDEMNKTIPF